MLWGTNVYVNNGVTMGPGPIVIGAYGNGGGRLWLQGNTNVGSTQQVIIESAQLNDTNGVYINCSAPTFGSLEGDGRVFFQTTSTLTVGGNNLSTNFYGTIADWSQATWAPGAMVGKLIKVGTGTLTLWGDTLLDGNVTVNGGTLAFNGTLSSPIVSTATLAVNSGGTLAGSGVIDRNVTVASGGNIYPGAAGTVATLDLNGSLTVASGGKLTYNLGATSDQIAFGTGARRWRARSM